MRVEIDKANITVIAVLSAPSLGLKKDMHALLDEIISLTSRLDWLLKHDEDAYKYGFFRLSVELQDGTRVPEKGFWELVTSLPEYDDKIVQYLRNLIAYAGERRKELWHDEQNPAGSFAANALALRNLPPSTKYVRLYADFLKSNDMFHETYQRDVIARILSAVMWNEDILYLIAVRLTSASGQFGRDLLEKRGDSLHYALQDERLRRFFLDLVEQEEFKLQSATLAPGGGGAFSLIPFSAIEAVVFADQPEAGKAWLNRIVDRALKTGFKVDPNNRWYRADAVRKQICKSLPS